MPCTTPPKPTAKRLAKTLLALIRLNRDSSISSFFNFFFQLATRGIQQPSGEQCRYTFSGLGSPRLVVYGPRVVVGESDGDRRLGDPKMSGVHRPFEPETSRSRVALHAAIRQPWREQCRSSMVRPPLSLCPRAPILTFAALQVSLHTTSGEGIPPFPPSIHRLLTSLSCTLLP